MPSPQGKCCNRQPCMLCMNRRCRAKCQGTHIHFTREDEAQIATNADHGSVYMHRIYNWADGSSGMATWQSQIYAVVWGVQRTCRRPAHCPAPGAQTVQREFHIPDPLAHTHSPVTASSQDSSQGTPWECIWHIKGQWVWPSMHRGFIAQSVMVAMILRYEI